MARRRGGRGRNPQARQPDLGAGGVASDGLQHGERQQVEDMAAMAPGGQPPPGAGGMPMGGGAPPPIPAGDPWGPTERPDESITAGLEPEGPGVLDEDPDEMLRALYDVFPHPDILDLLNARG